MQAVAAGNGFGILPCFLGDTDPRLMRVLTNEIALVRTFWMIVHSDTRDLARVRVTTDFIASEIRTAERFFLSSQNSVGTNPNSRKS
jgi:DNA-binding transcriptional LysR family regulator